MGLLNTTGLRILPALATAALTTAYYATPDLVRSRTGRGWAKAGIAVATGAVSALEFAEIRGARKSDRDDRVQVIDGDPDIVDTDPASPGDDSITAAWRKMPLTGRAAIFAGGVAALAVSLVGILAAEKAIFAFSERRASTGVAHAHTKTALVLGAIGGLGTLLPIVKSSPART